MEVVRQKMRRDHLANDALRHHVGNRALQPVADLDAQALVILGNDQDDAVIGPGATDFPLFGNADRILLYGFRLSAGQHQHRDLAAFPLLEGAQFGFERGKLPRVQRAGEIGDARLQRRHRDRVRRAYGRRKHQRHKHQRQDAEIANQRAHERSAAYTPGRGWRIELRSIRAYPLERIAQFTWPARARRQACRSSPPGASRSPSRSRPRNWASPGS